MIGKPRYQGFTLHCLRHFGASKLDNAGVPLCDIQEFLGHEQATTTAIYLQSLRGSTIEAVKKLEGLQHHFASTLVSNGVDLGIVRELLTHKHVGTTERYAHFAPATVKEAANKAGELLASKPGQVLKIMK